MRLPSPLLTAAAAATLTIIPRGPAPAQGTFEGVVTFQMSSGRAGPQTVQYSAKDGKARMDMSAGGMNMYIIFNPTANTMDMVIPDRQMYMEQSTAAAAARADSARDASRISWTGNKETIAGYECEHATITDDRGQTVDVCLARELGAFLAVGGGGMGGRGRGAGGNGGWEGHIGAAFPLKVTVNGQVELLATSIQKKTLDASLFVVPDGYNKMMMPMGGRGRGGR
jgi:hypothetical protein